VIFNPTAGGGRLRRSCLALERVAAERGSSLEWWQTGGPGHAEELATQAAAAAVPLVLAFGGDGTYNEVARGLLGSPTALGALPGGTTSVLCYELAVPRPPDVALASLLRGQDRPVRVGCTDRGQVFLLMLSAGPDALLLERLEPGLKRFGGRVGVALQAVLELLRRATLPTLRVRSEGGSVDGGWAILGKARSYAGPFPAAPGADPFAASLELVLQRGAGRWAAVRFFAGIVTGRHVDAEGVLCEQVRRVTLEPAPEAGKVPYQVDGDFAGYLPVEVGVDPRQLLVRFPG
jgi:diacylglycerol kinase family enzyme